MSKYSSYNTQRPESDKYSQYLDMPVYIRMANYDNYTFSSIFTPKFCDKKMGLKTGEIHYSDLLDLLTHAAGAKNYLNWIEVLQIKEFKAAAPRIEGLLAEPLKPEEPIYDDINPLDLKISPQPTYSKPNIQINYIRNSFPKMATVIENILIIAHELFYKFRLSRWKQRFKDVEEVKKDSTRFRVYQQNLQNYYYACKAWKYKNDQYEKKLIGHIGSNEI